MAENQNETVIELATDGRIEKADVETAICCVRVCVRLGNLYRSKITKNLRQFCDRYGWAKSRPSRSKPGGIADRIGVYQVRNYTGKSDRTTRFEISLGQHGFRKSVVRKKADASEPQ